MTREEMIALAQTIRGRDRFGPVSEEEFAQYPAVQTELALPGQAGRTVRVYAIAPAQGLPAPAPLVINLHGGGFIKGRADRDQLYCFRLACSLNCLVWDVDYCLAPEAPYPAAAEDCCGVLQYAFAHAAELGIDPQRILLAGHSAGGNLAAAACIQAARQNAPLPRAALLEYFPADLTLDPMDKLSPEQQADERAVARAKVEQQYTQMYCETAHQTEALASPLRAAPEELAAFPPCLVLACGQDSLCRETEVFALRLAQAGVTVTLRRFAQSPHGFTTNRTGEWEQAVALHLEFLQHHIQATGGTQS